MTKKELIELLCEFEGDPEVYFHDGHGSYRAIGKAYIDKDGDISLEPYNLDENEDW